MITLNAQKTTGKQLHRIIKKACNDGDISITKFFRKTRLARINYARFQHGTVSVPRNETFKKVASGLRWLGQDIKVIGLRRG